MTSESVDLQESIIKLADTNYWQSTFLNECGHPVSGGFGPSQQIARKIASSEFLERRFYYNIKSNSGLRSKWGLDIIPTGCGFAVGYNQANTIQRSVCEAVERWVMSQWIDNQKEITRVPESAVCPELDTASLYFLKQFDEVWYFLKTVRIVLGAQIFQIQVAQTMGFKDDGIFPGSSAQCSLGSLWQHSLLESYRHLLAFRNNPKTVETFPSNKVRYFGENAKVAVRQIEDATDKGWPSAQVRFFNVESQNDNTYYVARTILDGWESWHGGPLERFLY